MTVYENLKAMLAEAIELKRPQVEVNAIRAELARFNFKTPAQLRAAQTAFLKGIKS